jgi:hypothetical protein
MKIPVDLLEKEDLDSLSQILGRSLKIRNGLLFLPKSGERILLEAITANERMNLYEGVSRSLLVKAASALLSLDKQAKTVADRASIIGAVLSLASLEPTMGARLIGLVKGSVENEKESSAG